MDEIGNILRDAREMRGMTLEEVHESIRIRTRFLAALETGEYHLLPTPVHARGFLRNYARFLELDPVPLLERFETQKNYSTTIVRTASEQNGLPAEPSVSVHDQQPFFDPVNLDLDGRAHGTESRMRMVIIVALLITIGLAASRFVPLLLGRGDGRDNLPQVIEAIMTEDENEGSAPAGDDNLLPSETSLPISPTERNNPDGVATQAVASPTRPPLPATMDSIQLRLDITERTWLRVTIDGDVVLEDQVTREEGPFEWNAEQEANLLTGNAAGVFITINSIELGRLGARGEVAEETWTTTTSQ